MAAGKPTWIFSPLRTEHLGEGPHGRTLHRLIEPLRVHSAAGWGGCACGPLMGIRLTVPADFVTDWASVPRFWWRWFPPDGDHAAAAVVHDWLYRTQHGVTRFFADALFRDHMAALGVPLWKRWCMYMAVRLGSWRYWR